MTASSEMFRIAQQEIAVLGGPEKVVVAYVNKIAHDSEFLAKLQCGLVRDEVSWPNKTIICIAASEILLGNKNNNSTINSAAIQAIIFSQMQLTQKELEGIDPTTFLHQLTAYRSAPPEEKERKLAELSTRKIALRNTERAREFVQRLSKLERF